MRILGGGCWGLEVEWERFLEAWDAVAVGGRVGDVMSMGSDAIFGEFLWLMVEYFGPVAAVGGEILFAGVLCTGRDRFVAEKSKCPRGL